MSTTPRLARLPLILLGMLTVGTFAGPVAMLLVVRGGPSGEWPPDRPVEWVVIAAILTSVIALFVACVTVGWWYPWPDRGKGSAGR